MQPVSHFYCLWNWSSVFILIFMLVVSSKNALHHFLIIYWICLLLSLCTKQPLKTPSSITQSLLLPDKATFLTEHWETMMILFFLLKKNCFKSSVGQKVHEKGEFFNKGKRRYFKAKVRTKQPNNDISLARGKEIMISSRSVHTIMQQNMID